MAAYAQTPVCSDILPDFISNFVAPMIRSGVTADQFEKLYNEAKETQWKQTPAAARRDNSDRFSNDVMSQFIINCAQFVNMQTIPNSTTTTTPVVVRAVSKKSNSGSVKSVRRSKTTRPKMMGGGHDDKSESIITGTSKAVSYKEGTGTALLLVHRKQGDKKNFSEMALKYGLTDATAGSSKAYQNCKPL